MSGLESTDRYSELQRSILYAGAAEFIGRASMAARTGTAEPRLLSRTFTNESQMASGNSGFTVVAPQGEQGLTVDTNEEIRRALSALGIEGDLVSRARVVFGGMVYDAVSDTVSHEPAVVIDSEDGFYNLTEPDVVYDIIREVTGKLWAEEALRKM